MQPPQARLKRVSAAFVLCAFALFAPGLSSAQSAAISNVTHSQAPLPEVRGLWVVRNSIESPEQIHNLVQAAAASGFNTLFVQVRGRGDAFYNSSLEPRAQELSKQPASFDPLQTVIDDAHARGLQVHAWVNACYVWSSTTPPKSPEHIVNQHPDWMARNSDGKFSTSPKTGAGGAFVSPSNPSARQELHDVCMELTKNYDIDGLHLDYIRYADSDYDYSAQAVGAFASTMRGRISEQDRKRLDEKGDESYVAAYPLAWASWRRDQVSSLVQWISSDAKRAKPWVCVSAAVYADWKDAFENRGQDWHRWLADGSVDAVIPMAYSKDTSVVAQQIRDAEAVARASGRVCYAGIGSWRIPSDSTVAKIEAAREDGAQGVVIFSYGGVTLDGSTNAYLDNLSKSAFQIPAEVPQIPSVGMRPSASAVSQSTSDQGG